MPAAGRRSGPQGARGTPPTIHPIAKPSAALTTGTIRSRPDLSISALFGTPTHPSPRPTAPFCLPPRAEWTSCRSARRLGRARGVPFLSARRPAGRVEHQSQPHCECKTAAIHRPAPRVACVQVASGRPFAHYLAGLAVDALSTRLPCRRRSSPPVCLAAAGAARGGAAGPSLMRAWHVAWGPRSKKMARAGGRLAVSCRARVYESME